MLGKKVWVYLRYVIFALLTVSVSVGVVSCNSDPLTGYVGPVDEDESDGLDKPDEGGGNQ
ncbi:MAG: hypothetical protein IIA59_13035 [Candidatus Marinimicrobia bacterium]|nr:hypothetical protein [Candidatus Neomarinimicrobiota bacterium]